MRILITYGTNSTGTQEVAQIIQAELEHVQHAVTVLAAQHVDPATVASYDAVVLGSCTWDRRTETGKLLEGQLQYDMFALLEKLRDQKLDRKRFVVFALGDRRFTDFCAAADFLEAFVKEKKGTLLHQSLRIDGYFFRLEETRKQARDWAQLLCASLVAP